MSDRTAIEWCDSTFNPWIGCTKVSPACDHCYAEAQMDTRMGRVEWGAGKPRSRTSAAYWKQPLRWNARIFWQCDTCGWRGEGPHLDGLLDDNDESVRELCPQCWPEPIAVKLARRRVFCASLADVFDNEVPISWLADLLSLIYSTPSLDWLLLTKRIGNWRARISAAVDTFEHRMANGYGDNHGYSMARNWLLGEHANIWLGATVANQQEADRDIPKLLAVPAAKRFLSIEPMLGPIDLSIDGLWNTECGRCEYGHQCPETGAWECSACDGTQKSGEVGIDWVICGGESGPHARPMHPDWVRSLRDQCAAAGVPFLFKQWGEWAPYRLHVNGDLGGDLRSGRVQHLHAPGNPDGFFRRGDSYVERVGKRVAGRQLDGREHSEWPS